MIFTKTLVNVLMTLFYMIPGYIVHKLGKTKTEHLSTLSALLVYVGTPFLEISAFIALDYSLEMLRDMGIFFLITFFSQLFLIISLYFILRKKFHIPTYRLLTIGSVFGNVGFFGMPIVRAIFPDNPEVACFSAIYMVSMNLLVFTAGICCITGDRKYISLKSALCSPNVLGLIIALPLYLTGAKNYLPEVLKGGISTMGSITTPLCMFILGIRLASMSIKKVFGNKMSYIAVAIKLLVFPMIAFGVANLVHASYYICAAALILSATPCASVVLNFSEMYDGEKEMAANCILISMLLCFITIPVLSLLL